MYRADSVIDLTLKVTDLLVVGSDYWNRDLVLRTFTDNDADRIFRIKPKTLNDFVGVNP